MVERRSPKSKAVGSMPTRPAFQLFSKRLPPVKRSSLARSLNLLIWADGRVWIEWTDNHGLWKMKHISRDYALKLIEAAGLIEIKPQEMADGT